VLTAVSQFLEPGIERNDQAAALRRLFEQQGIGPLTISSEAPQIGRRAAVTSWSSGQNSWPSWRVAPARTSSADGALTAPW